MSKHISCDLGDNTPNIAKILADFIVNHPSKGWAKEVEHEAHRTFINWISCAIGAANHITTETALRAVKRLQPSHQAAVFGRSERLDMMNAALINGISSHTFDYDDTHLDTIIHPAGPVASATLALAENIEATGREIIDALVIGIDVFCRIGRMIYPDHYDIGWHITGSTGAFGAAAACARILKLSVEKTQMALGIAASQPVGFREQFGTMTKPFHPGGAAMAGLIAALLAKEGFTSSDRAIEGARGFAQVVSKKFDWDAITYGLGNRFEISLNTYKPFACGIVIHPSIDGCIKLKEKYDIKAENIESVQLRVNGLVLELTGKEQPKNGLESKFSVYHSCAAALIFNQASETEYSDKVVNREDVIALRSKVQVVVDNSVHEASADVTITDNKGNSYHMFIEHAVGSVEKPMTDSELNDKAKLLIEPVLGSKKLTKIKEICWSLSEQSNVNNLIASATK